MHENRTLGILGGMGPAATADFIAKLIQLTPANCDQDHFPFVVVNDPSVPDRTHAFFENRENDVLNALKRSLKRLEAAGANAVAMPCNSAHHWADQLQNCTALPLLHIADASIAEARRHRPAATSIAVMATPITIASGFYNIRIQNAGLDQISPSRSLLEDRILPGIRSVKAGDIGAGAQALSMAADQLLEDGADTVLLACTEIPIALKERLKIDPRLIDTTDALAKYSAEWLSQKLPKTTLHGDACLQASA